MGGQGCLEVKREGEVWSLWDPGLDLQGPRRVSSLAPPCPGRLTCGFTDVKVFEMFQKHLALLQAGPLQVSGSVCPAPWKSDGPGAHRLGGQAALTALGELRVDPELNPHFSSWGT